MAKKPASAAPSEVLDPQETLKTRRSEVTSMAAKLRATVIAAATPEERHLIRLTPDTERAMFAETLWTRFTPKHEIIEQIQQTYSVSASVATSDINRVIRYYAEVDKEARSELKSQMRATLKDGYRRCIEWREFGPAVQFLDKLCKLDNLYDPDPPPPPPAPLLQIDATKLTKEERDALRIVQGLAARSTLPEPPRE